jgi:hypothetical protein
MRVCKYEVIGEYGSTIPDTVIDPEDVPTSTSNTIRLDTSNENQEDDSDEEFDHWNFSISQLKTLSAEQLMEISLRDLRWYATNVFKIVGASKILGGKVALVDAILRVK